MILYFFMTKLCVLFLGDRVMTILFLSRGVGRNLLPEETFPITTPPLKEKHVKVFLMALLPYSNFFQAFNSSRW